MKNNADRGNRDKRGKEVDIWVLNHETGFINFLRLKTFIILLTYKIRNLFAEIFGFSEINVVGLTSKQWIILYPKFYAAYEYTDESQII